MTATPIKVSQGFDVLRPKGGECYPVPCGEWDVVRKEIEKLTTDPWLFQSAGALLIGAGLATLISIQIGAVVPSKATPNADVIAWAVVVVCGLTGAASLIFANLERGVHRAKAAYVVTQMRLIEERFERGG